MNTDLNNPKLDEALKKIYSLWFEDSLIFMQVPMTVQELLDEYKEYLTEEQLEEFKKLGYETGDKK